MSLRHGRLLALVSSVCLALAVWLAPARAQEKPAENRVTFVVVTTSTKWPR